MTGDRRGASPAISDGSLCGAEPPGRVTAFELSGGGRRPAGRCSELVGRRTTISQLLTGILPRLTGSRL